MTAFGMGDGQTVPLATIVQGPLIQNLTLCKEGGIQNRSSSLLYSQLLERYRFGMGYYPSLLVVRTAKKGPSGWRRRVGTHHTSC
jgi:hypothetical protein